MRNFIRSVVLGAALLFLSSAAFAQGARYDGIAIRSSGGTGFPMATAGSSALITVCTSSGTGAPCTPSATIFADQGLTMPANNAAPAPGMCSSFVPCAPTTNPFFADAYGNYGFWTTPGTTYIITITGQGLAPSTIVWVAPIVASTTIAVTTNQIAFATAPGVLGGSNNFTYNGTLHNINGGGSSTIFSLTNPTAATSLANQNSPLASFSGNYWNGSSSSVDLWTSQIIEGAGTNPTSEFRIIGGLSPGGQLFHVEMAFTADGNINTAGAVLSQLGFNSPRVSGINNYSMVGNTPASSGANVSSGTSTWDGNIWNGSTSVHDFWAIENVEGTGTNPTSTFSVTHTGSTGLLIASIPGIMYSCGTIAAGGACVPVTSGNSHCFSGVATLGGGTSTITGINPPFTSSTSYNVVTNDLTTPANSSKGVPASGTSITFTGTGTDNLSFNACGE